MRQRNGFTLLETIIAIAIFMLVIGGMFQGFSFQSGVIQTSKQGTVATNLAQATVEEVLTKSYGSITSEPRVSFPSPNNEFEKEVIIEYLANVNGGLVVTGVDEEMKKVTVIVYYVEKGEEKKVQLVSLASKY
ncbi:MAG TPA: prepilin-type N-terminal cleavage/methylation domain-containing protein [Patescibacteria group bacterium]|nr:prepilin-type N-terminal cleavage/methylation domain-containing protein [Patescibacteria group bacterium]